MRVSNAEGDVRREPVDRNFLLRRLQEAGIRHIFGVPGDYNLELMQQLEDRGEPAWRCLRALLSLQSLRL